MPKSAKEKALAEVSRAQSKFERTRSQLRQSSLHLWISAENSAWQHSEPYKDYSVLHNTSRTPTYHESLYIPFGTSYTFNLFVRVGHHTETLHYLVFSAEGEIQG